MEPFSIRCDTCAAKLKVTNPSAVGQKLACPKCGSMIHVQAPEGWQLPEELPANEEKLANDSSGEFDDIDQILKQKKVSRSQRKPARKPARKAPARRQAQNPSPKSPIADTSATPTPVLPNESWTASTTQKRQRNLLIGAGLVGILVIGGAIVVAINVGGKQDTTEQVAENPEETTPANDKAQSDKNDGSETATDSVRKDPATDIKQLDGKASTSPDSLPPADESNSESPADNTSAADENAMLADDKQPIPVDIDPPSDSSANGAQNPDADPEEASLEQDQPSSPFDSSLDEFLSLTLTDVDDVTTNFDDLSEALERGGSSLFEINQFARLNSKQRRIGLPKYFIKLPGKLDPRNLQRLNDPLRDIQYNNHSFLQVLAEITEMTGVPISFDTENLIFKEFDFGFPLQDFRVTDTTFAGLIQAALSESGRELTLEYDGNSTALITIENRNSLQTEILQLPDLQKVSPPNFVLLLQQMIAPGTWQHDPQESLLELEGTNLKIVHRPFVVEKVRRFIQKWNVALKVKNNDSEPGMLDSRWKLSAVSRAAKASIILDSDLPILEFAADLKRDYDFNLLIDFQSLLESGWNPQTAIPLGFAEQNVDQLISEIAHSMDVAYRAINANTFELLSKERLLELTEVEFYSCSKILSGQLNQQQLFELVRQSLQSANRLDGSTRAYFEAEIECFIVVGSQDVQKLIRSVLQRLEDL